jgi:hypothetical protein
MKHPSSLARLSGILALVFLLAGCATVSTVNKESLLSQAGFLLLPPENPKQTALFQSLQPGKITTLQHAGKTMYLYPVAGGTKAYIGQQKQYDAYSQLRAAQRSANDMSVEETMRMERYDGSGGMPGGKY